MDKLINKVKKSLDKGERQVKVLAKADKKQDAKLERCNKSSCSSKRKAR